MRNRTCDNPPPSNGGTDCEGEAAEERKCNDDPCPGIMLSLRMITHSTLTTMQPSGPFMI